MITSALAHVALGEGEVAALIHAVGGFPHALALLTIGAVVSPSRAALRDPPVIAGIVVAALLAVTTCLIEVPLDLSPLSVAAAALMGLQATIDRGHRGHVSLMVIYIGTYALQQGQHVAEGSISPLLLMTTSLIATALWLLAGGILSHAGRGSRHERLLPRALGGAVVLAGTVSLAIRLAS